MPDLETTFATLRDFYVSYYETPFELRDEGVMRERRELLLREGEIFRRPFLEVLPGYKSSNRSPAAAATDLGLDPDFADFVSCGLFPPGRDLYVHQFDT